MSPRSSVAQSCLTLCNPMNRGTPSLPVHHQLEGYAAAAAAAAAAAKSRQLRPTLCNPIDGSPPGSPIPGILQAEHWSGLPFCSPCFSCPQASPEWGLEAPALARLCCEECREGLCVCAGTPGSGEERSLPPPFPASEAHTRG